MRTREEQYVSFITASVNNLTRYTSQISRKTLRRHTGMFLATTLDAELTKKKEMLKEISVTASKAAAFIISHQLLLYHLLSSSPASLFRRLHVHCSLEDIQKAFDRVCLKDFQAIFNCRLLPLLPRSAQELINSIAEQFRILKIENQSSDIIGKVFHSLIPYNLRKRIAAYYTSNPAARLLAHLTIENPDAKVGDFACGSGTMLVEAYKRKRELLQSHSSSACKQHTELLRQIYGVDVCMFSGHLAAMNLFIQEPRCFPERMNIVIDDAFNVLPNNRSPLPIESETTDDDFVSTAGSILLPDHFDAILINPPFTDRRRMTKKYVKSVDWTVGMEGKTQYVRGQFHLGLYFILHCEEFLDDGAFLGIVIPESILQNVGSRSIIDFILDHFNVYALISSNAQIAFSEDTDWKEILLVLVKSKTRKRPTRFITLNEMLSYENAKEFAEFIKKGEVPTRDQNRISLKLVSRKELETEKNWIRILRKDKMLEHIRNTAKTRLRPGEDVWRQK